MRSRGRRTGAVAAVVTATLLGACGDSHERDVGSVDAGVLPRVDSGVRVRDAAGVPDAPVAVDSGPTCASSERRVTVRLERVGSAPCEGPRLAGELIGHAPAPDADGVRFDVDLCPGADEDCRCAIVVGGIGADVYERLQIEPDAFEATVSPSSIVLFASADGGEAGVYPDSLMLYAEDSYLDRPSYAVEGISLASEEECRVPSGSSPVGPCHAIGYAAHVVVSGETAGWPRWTEDGFARVREGESVTLSGTFVTARILRANEGFCGPEGSPAPPSPEAAFVLWWYYPPAP